jgi:transaldolase/glucose-6-phosphate isomerase
MAGNPPVDVQQYGQSIWYDNIRRRLITSGELARLIEEDGVLGVTSNPTIFQKAIGGSSDYDDAIMTLLELDPYDIYERLAIEDIQRALDLFRPIYDRTGGVDGYVSLEVSPLIANDSATTASEARRLFAAVDRPNAMIKIPATPAGIPAIEEAIAAGINVNVTLIFSVDNYIEVAEAFIRGLERRLAAGEDVTRIASVASFFLSRIDTAVDRMLDSNIRAAQMRGDVGRVTFNNNLKGKTAIANAKVAYRRFRELFHGERFAALNAAGAMPQRLLWASTGTKNPAYPDTLYLDSLIGAQTVNTVPPDTLALFKDHGTAAPTLEADYEDAVHVLDMLAEAGIDLNDVTAQLQLDGVESFVDSFHSLLEQVEAKRDVLRTGVMRQQQVMLGVYADAVRDAIRILSGDHINGRIWNRDGTVWHDSPSIVARIQENLGWLTAEGIDLDRLQALADRTFDPPLDAVVVLGMGGGGTAPYALVSAFGSAPGQPRLLLLDTTSPAAIRALEAQLDLARTLFIVTSKSGTTLETTLLYQYFYARTGGSGAQFIAITDANTPLAAEAERRGFLDVFINPPGIGGRFGAMSYAGLVPAALCGVNFKLLAASASRMRVACGATIPAEHHPGIWLGAILAEMAKAGRDKLTLHTSPSIAAFGAWVEGLIAESLGKEGKGILPVFGATVGKPHDFSSDRLFVVVRVDGDDNAELDAGITVLQQAGHPIVILHLTDALALGGEFFRWSFAVSVAARLLGVNPFDEPNVAESKSYTTRILHDGAPDETPIAADGDVSLYADARMHRMLEALCQQQQFDAGLSGLLAAQFNATLAGDYIALLAYLPHTPAIAARLDEIRRRLRHVTKRAVTVGFGPAYLHTSGQLHKGGGAHGVYLVLTADDEPLLVPGGEYDFARVIAAQAAGDVQALNNHARRVVRLHLGKDIMGGLDVLWGAIERAAERRQ